MANRIVYIDYAKVFVAYLVIFCHLMDYGCPGRMYAYAFHMHFFFLDSGMLHKDNGTIQWKKYALTLLVPVATFNLLVVLVCTPFFYYEAWNSVDGLNVELPSKFWMIFLAITLQIFKGLWSSGSMPDGPAWFLVALFGCKIMTDFINSLKCKQVLKWGGVICFALISIKLHHLYIGQAFMAMPFYYFGFLYRENIHNFLGKFKPIIGFLVALILTVILTKINGRVTFAGLSFGKFGFASAPLFYCNGLVGSFVLLFLANCFKERPIITNTAKALLSILVLQRIFLLGFENTYGMVAKLTAESVMTMTIASIAIYIACYWLHKILYRYTPWMYGIFSRK